MSYIKYELKWQHVWKTISRSYGWQSKYKYHGTQLASSRFRGGRHFSGDAGAKEFHKCICKHIFVFYS